MVAHTGIADKTATAKSGAMIRTMAIFGRGMTKICYELDDVTSKGIIFYEAKKNSYAYRSHKMTSTPVRRLFDGKEIFYGFVFEKIGINYLAESLRLSEQSSK
jgi:hypothetical protein